MEERRQSSFHASNSMAYSLKWAAWQSNSHSPLKKNVAAQPQHMNACGSVVQYGVQSTCQRFVLSSVACEK